jgi:hypothetical protein
LESLGISCPKFFPGRIPGLWNWLWRIEEVIEGRGKRERIGAMISGVVPQTTVKI